MLINPIEIIGNWDKGFVLDKHISKSEFLGNDIYGYSQFKTERTKLGELVYQLKYQNNFLALDEIIIIIKSFLDNWKELKMVDIILPVPSSKI
ncbi:MAG: hypothetical protein M0R46_14735 [Candidatus Muirbacterium halophilum]|nr:hypothetical protein [Candidatus Muirbacterium halophilum]